MLHIEQVYSLNKPKSPNSFAVTRLTDPLSKHKKPYQLHGVFRPELLHHGVKLSAPRLWCCVVFLGRRSWRGSCLVLNILFVAFLQQVDSSLHEGKALPNREQRHKNSGRAKEHRNTSFQMYRNDDEEATLVLTNLFWSLPLLWKLSSCRKMAHLNHKGGRISVNLPDW